MSDKPSQRMMDSQFKRGDHRISTRAGVEIVAEVREPGLGRVGALILDLYSYRIPDALHDAA